MAPIIPGLKQSYKIIFNDKYKLFSLMFERKYNFEFQIIKNFSNKNTDFPLVYDRRISTISAKHSNKITSYFDQGNMNRVQLNVAYVTVTFKADSN